MVAALWMLATVAPIEAQAAPLVLATSMAPEDSGLLRYLVPRFTRDSGIEVTVKAVGSRRALEMATRGEADATLTNDPAAEDKAVADGHAAARTVVMHNDFVIVGPRTDPAGIRGRDATAAMEKLAQARQPFVSRGDRSGTHAAELRVWAEAKVLVAKTRPEGYQACNCSMVEALNKAVASEAYTLTDRASWLSHRNRGNLVALVEGDPQLYNAYAALVMDPKRHRHAKSAAAQTLADWLVSPIGQTAIAAFRVQGQALFFPNPKPPRPDGPR
jgi:tungstate transport system substrate-binding protein